MTIQNSIPTGIYLPIKLLLIGLCLCSFSLHSQSSTLDTYQLDYVTQVKGFKLKAVRILNEVNGHYSLSQITTTTILETQESAVFTIDKNANFVSSNSGYLRKVLGSRLQRTTTFDHKKHQVLTLENKDKPITFNIPAIVFDSLTYQERIRFELIESKGKHISGTYPIAEKTRMRDYKFAIIGNDIISTPMGNMDCLKIERVRDSDSDKKTTIWLAKNWSYVIVKILHQEENEPDYQLNLIGGLVHGSTIKGLASTTQRVAK